MYINIPREDSVFSLLRSYLFLNVEVSKKTDTSRYADGNDIIIVNSGPVASISDFKLTTSSEKHLEDLSHANSVSFLYKLIVSAKRSDDLFIGFDRYCVGRQDELKKQKDKWKIPC